MFPKVVDFYGFIGGGPEGAHFLLLKAYLLGRYLRRNQKFIAIIGGTWHGGSYYTMADRI